MATELSNYDNDNRAAHYANVSNLMLGILSLNTYIDSELVALKNCITVLYGDFGYMVKSLLMPWVKTLISSATTANTTLQGNIDPCLLSLVLPKVCRRLSGL